MGSSPRVVWDMTDPHVAGGQVKLYDWRTHPNYHLWYGNRKPDLDPVEVSWWSPSYIVSVAQSKRFSSVEAATRFYDKMIKRGYVEKETE